MHKNLVLIWKSIPELDSKKAKWSLSCGQSASHHIYVQSKQQECKEQTDIIEQVFCKEFKDFYFRFWQVNKIKGNCKIVLCKSHNKFHLPITHKIPLGTTFSTKKNPSDLAQPLNGGARVYIIIFQLKWYGVQIIIFKNITITINFPPVIPNYPYGVSKNFSQTTKGRIHHQN